MSMLTRIRYSHLLINPKFTTQKTNILINVLGDRKCVDKASWEIKTFGQEKSLMTANIVLDYDLLRGLMSKNNHDFIVNRCYNLSCDKLLNDNNMFHSGVNWKLYNFYVLPHATNRFNTCDFIRGRNNFIIYPLAAPIEKKRRDVHILIDN